MNIRPYAPKTDREALWDLKRAFETEIGDETGDADKREAYAEKLSPAYRERYLGWVDRCYENDRRCLSVAEHDSELVGYVFVLPERLALIWDAAVINEIYVTPGERGTGVADALLEAALSVARDQELPLDRVVLDVDRENERARSFYERHGFVHWGEMVARPI